MKKPRSWKELLNHPDADKTRHSDSSEYIKLEMKSMYQKEAS